MRIVSEVLPEFDFVTWYGVTAPAGTPTEALQRLSREIGVALALPDVKERLASLGVQGAPSTPEAFSGFITTQADRLRRLVQVTGVKPE